MLLAISVEEFTTWRDRLAQVAPNTPIINEIGQSFVAEHDQGKPWYELIAQMLPSFYNRSDPAHDRQRYGNAASLLRRLIRHRSQLRLPRDVYVEFVKEYGILALRLWSQASRLSQESSWSGSADLISRQSWAKDWHSRTVTEELTWGLAEALPIVEECVERYPGDDEFEKLILEPMREILSGR
jgi:hypothetical protein